jgi:hypothetical protein
VIVQVRTFRGRDREVELRKVQPTGRNGYGSTGSKSKHSPYEWPHSSLHGAFSAYEVWLLPTRKRDKPRRLGFVASMREEAERYVPGSRIRFPNGVSRFWIATTSEQIGREHQVGYHHYSRQYAVEELVREALDS